MTARSQAPDEEARRRVLALLRRHGWNATSFQVLEPAFRYWFDEDGEGCVAYADTGRAWVVAGAPIAAQARLGEVARRFVDVARAHGRRVCFFAVEERFAGTAPLRARHIGEQPVWDPAEWEATVRSSRSLREQLRRARAKGVSVRPVGPEEIAEAGGPTRAAIERLIARWLDSRQMAPMGFLVDVHPFAFPEERRYLVAEVDGACVAFLAAVPVYARGGWLLEDLLRDPAAPNGTAELLVDEMMRRLASEGSRYATLGLAPLAGAVGGWLRVAREWTSELYDFRGVQAFKAKLKPRAWEPIYLAYPEPLRSPVAVYDTLAAFARGSLSRFGLQTVLRAPALAVQLLAGALVPWTAMLAAARPWFPSGAVQKAWIAFDCVLAVALFILSAQWRPWLAALLAAAISADSLLTLIEILRFNAPRAHGLLDWLVLAVAWLAPTSAAALLWGATLVRARWLRMAAGPPGGRAPP